MAAAARLEDALGRLWWRTAIAPAAIALLPLAALYALLMALRRALYRAGWLRCERAPVPVLVVGNLVVGGAGKTPTVIALVHALQREGWCPGVISRGHGRSSDACAPVEPTSGAGSVGDEPIVIRRRTGVPVWVGRRRVEAARALCAAQPRVDVLVSDDGLQHLALARDVQVVVFDERGVGNGWPLPAGPLREPLSRWVPVNTHVLYNAPHPSTRWPGALAMRRLAGAAALDDWWRGSAPSPDVLASLRGRPLVAAAGIAAPRRFFDMLRDAGLDIAPLPLPDHHAFEPLPWPADTADVVVTEKDAAKLQPARCGATHVWVVTLDLVLPGDFTAAVLDNLRLVRRPYR